MVVKMFIDNIPVENNYANENLRITTEDQTMIQLLEQIELAVNEHKIQFIFPLKGED
jgi:hypothetical protein